MINIDFLTLKAFFTENKDFLLGARLQKIQQPSKKDLILFLRNNSESRKLYININPDIYHIAFISPENEQKRNIIIPKQPPMFCMLLRKYLEGCKIFDIKVVENERIAEFYFETTDEFSQRRSLCLCTELMGKHSNIILYDRKTSVIIGCAHNVGPEKSKYRELQGGMKYIRPPKLQGNLVLSNELQEQFKNIPSVKITEYLQTDTFRPAIKENRYTLFSELLPNSIPQKSVNEMLDNYYSDIQERQILAGEKNTLRTLAKNKLNRVKSSIDKIEILLKKRDNTEKYRLYGTLLTANIYQNKDFQTDIEVWDYVNNQNITIPLDSSKTVNENAQRYFRLYNKSKATKEKSAEILNDLKMQKEYLESILYSIEIAENLSELEDIQFENEKSGKPKNKKVSATITKLDINGFTVYVGKNNRQNDYIISKLAKDEDYWFHTKTCAGSHVLLKSEQNKPDENTIFECCKLARKYSSAAQPSKVGVIYTKRKFIKKTPAAPLGYVTYKNEKEVLI